MGNQPEKASIEQQSSPIKTMKLSVPICFFAYGFIGRFSTAFTNPRTTDQQTCCCPTVNQRALRHTVFQSAISDNITTGANHTIDDSDEKNNIEDAFDTNGNSMLVPARKYSKAKWKKKRFLMVQDVKQFVEGNHPKAAQKAEDMIRRMRTLYEKIGDEDIRPPLQAFNLWINALAKSKEPNAGLKAEKVLEQMQVEGVAPNIITYTSVMDAHARSKDPQRAQEVLFRLLDSSSGGDGGVGLTSITSDTILNAWAQQGTYDSAERAQTILFRLEEWQRDEIRPTKISYATVMNAWAQVGSTEAAEQAEALLDRMLQMKVVQPDTIVFNAAINAWATSKDQQGGKRALAILKKMRQLAKDGFDANPDIVTYNTVLSAWSHSGDVNAAPYTEKIVQGMQRSASESETAPAPNTVTYNTILNAWAKSKLPGAAPRAQKVLDYMIKSKNESIAPDVISFASVLDAWAKSKEPHKGAKCQELLNRLLKMYEETRNHDLRPTIYTYNAVLNACAFSAMGTSEDEQREALQIAVQTFSTMRQSDTLLDTVTYGNMLKCLANLMPEGEMRTTMALQIFDKCIDDGLVGALVWNEVRRAVPAKLLTTTYQLKGAVANIQVQHLPRKWKRFNQNDRKNQHTKRKETPQGSASSRQRPTQTIIENCVQSGKNL